MGFADGLSTALNAGNVVNARQQQVTNNNTNLRKENAYNTQVAVVNASNLRKEKAINKQQDIVNARANRNEARRNNRDRLEARVKGYTINKDGSYSPNEMGANNEAIAKTKTEIELQRLQAQNIMMNKAMEEFKSINNTRSMTDGLILASKGNPNTAWETISMNPTLKKTLEDKGITEIATVDWVNDRELYGRIPNLVIDETTLQDPTKIKALNSKFHKVRKDGKWEISDTEAMIHRTNTKKYLNADERVSLTDSYNIMGQILKGVVKTPQEMELARTTTDIAVNENNVMLQWLQDNPTKGVVDYSNSKKLESAVNIAQSKQDIKNTPSPDIDFSGTTTVINDEIANWDGKGKFKFSDNARNKVMKQEARLNADNKGNTKVNATTLKIASDKVAVISDLSKANALLHKVGTLEKNAMSKASIDIMKYFNRADSNSEDTLKMMTKIDAYTNLGIAKYVKVMSGAAVTNEEREMFINIITGGSYSSGTELATRLDVFLDSIVSELDNTVSTLSNTAPMSMFSIKEKLVTVKSDIAKDRIKPTSKDTFVDFIGTTNTSTEQGGTTPSTQEKFNRPKMISF